MGYQLDTETLGSVFHARPDILTEIERAADSPTRIALFNNIASFVAQQISDAEGERTSKRRRVDLAPDASAPRRAVKGEPVGADAAAMETVVVEIREMSVVVPQRKKYDLCFTSNFLYARLPNTKTPVPGIVYRLADIEHAFYLPVPEKNQVQHNFVLFPGGSYLPSKAPAVDAQEPLVFTVNAGAPKPGSIGGTAAPAAESVADSYSTLVHWALAQALSSAGNAACCLLGADARLFHSAVRQANRPGEKAVHVKAFRGSKDGYLFFLPTGILWGFKKPLLFLPLNRILSLSYTSVLQRTFNLAVEMKGAEGRPGEEMEFSMIDQEDYQRIDETYVRRHGLADRSMAERRRARRELAENGKGHRHGHDEGKGEEEDEDDGQADSAGAGRSELATAEAEAEQHLQDEEDEEEEDYDPGSGGDSEGSGESSENEDEGADADADGQQGESDQDET